MCTCKVGLDYAHVHVELDWMGLDDVHVHIKLDWMMHVYM